MSAFISLALSLGWLLLWLVGVGIAVWQIVRGRALAGALIGLASVGGLLLRLAPGIIELAMPTLFELIGFELAIGVRRTLLGCGDALVVLLLILGGAVQRPDDRCPRTD